jgi:hypothetical protein
MNAVILPQNPRCGLSYQLPSNAWETSRLPYSQFRFTPFRSPTPGNVLYGAQQLSYGGFWLPEPALVPAPYVSFRAWMEGPTACNPTPRVSGVILNAADVQQALAPPMSTCTCPRDRLQ